jgi:hypothetical protein|tara:strand:- start:1550 stop:1951 length:402 start_codon:yes stop_codon:yes gene_type:complete
MAETRSASKLTTILSAAAGAGSGTAMSVAPYQHIVVAFASDNAADLTVSCQGSIADAEPDWAGTPSVTVDWDLIGLQHLDDGTILSGDTGLVIATDSVFYYMVNTDALNWLNFDVTTYVAGDVTVQVRAFNNS